MKQTNSGKKRGRVTLAPLTLEVALQGALQVKPSTAGKSKPKKRRTRR